MLVQFLIENSAEIFGGDIASLFQRPEKKKSRSVDDLLGKMVAGVLIHFIFPRYTKMWATFNSINKSRANCRGNLKKSRKALQLHD